MCTSWQVMNGAPLRSGWYGDMNAGLGIADTEVGAEAMRQLREQTSSFNSRTTTLALDLELELGYEWTLWGGAANSINEPQSSGAGNKEPRLDGLELGCLCALVTAVGP